jgi:hypothetical protein
MKSYWIVETTIKKFLWWNIETKRVIGECKDEYAGNIPFFNLNSARYTLRQLNKVL